MAEARTDTASTASWADVMVLNGRTYQRSMDVPAGERVYILDFHLHDGTLVSRGYNWDANLLGGIMPPPALRGITPPPEFQTELEQAMTDDVVNKP